MIRPALPGDAAAIAAVHVRSWQQAYRELMPEDYLTALGATLDRRSTYWRQTLEAGAQRVSVAIVDEQLVGWIAYGQSRDVDAVPGGTGEVTALYLLAEHWGTGIGAALWQAAHEQLIDQGYGALTLWVLVENARAIGFYRNLGLAAEPESVRSLSRGGRTLEEVRYRTHL